MADSLSTWLSLREAADAAARSEALTRAIREAIPRRTPVRVLDLGSGTGSNVRYLSPRLPSPQQWLLVDRDPTLLARAPAGTAAVQIDTLHRDLGTLDDPRLFAGRDLVTASALLDLVSDRWLRSLAAHCRATGAAALFALTYNGRSSCTPAEPEDGFITNLMNRHQKKDKGLGGPADGPDAVDSAEESFAAVGYVVRSETSDWTLPPEAREFQRRLIHGWAEAAIDIAPAERGTIEAWLRRRLAHVDAGRSRIVVGHDDLAAWLP
jgi:SAM-dependent methyltransferase